MANPEFWTTLIMSIIGAGGFTVVVNAIMNRKRNKSEVTSINVETAVKLESVAMARYIEASQSLDEAQKLLATAKQELMDAKRELSEAKQELIEARKEYEIYKKYSLVLQGILVENDIDIPNIDLIHMPQK